MGGLTLSHLLSCKGEWKTFLGERGQRKIPDAGISPRSHYTYRPLVRTHDAKRNNFPVELTPPNPRSSALLSELSWHFVIRGGEL